MKVAERKYWQVREEPCVEFRKEIMMVNGVPTNYERQTLRNDSFYLAELGIDLPIEEGIQAFDERYFDFMLIKTVIEEIETSHLKVGLQLLQNLPKMPEKSYVNLIIKLSLNKIRHILMDRNFYIFLWTKGMIFNSHPQESTHISSINVDLCLGELDQPLKRILFMIQFLPCSMVFKQALSITATNFVDDIISQKTFLQSLKETKRTCILSESDRKIEWSTKNKDFLLNIIDSFKTIVLLSQAPLQINEVMTNYPQRPSSQLFTKECIAMISLHFDQYFNYDRKHLIEVLALIAIEQGSLLWPEIISKRYLKKDQKKDDSSSSTGSALPGEGSIANSQSSTCETDNEASFLLLMINNFYEPSQYQWQNTLIILESLIKWHSSQSHGTLIRIFLQTTRHTLDSSIITLSIDFIRNVGGKQKRNKNFTFFLLQFLSIVNEDIIENCKIYENKPLIRGHKRKNNKLPAQKHNLFVSFFRLYTILLDLHLIDVIVELNCQKTLEDLMKMTAGCKGVIEGARRRFIDKKTAFVVSEQLLRQKSTRLDQVLEKPLFRQFSLLKPRQFNITTFLKFLKKL